MKDALIRSSGSLDGALKEMRIEAPKQIVINPAVDPELSLRAASDYISFKLAGCEALWGLVHSGVFVMASNNVTGYEPSISWTTVYGNSGGQSAGWQLSQFKSSFPAHVHPSMISDRDQMLSDSDLFLHRLAIPEIHPEIESALRDAVLCFRAELYTPAVVMLGKASEGAWIETGLALAGFIGSEEPNARKLTENIGGSEFGFAKKMREIMNFFETRQPAFKRVAQQAGITLHDMRVAMQWSETLRDARNAVHHEVESFAEHTYETVAVLLLATIPSLRTLHGLNTACRAESANRATQ